DQPVKANLLAASVERLVVDDDPFLIGRRRDSQWPLGQPSQAPCLSSIRIAPGVSFGRDFGRPFNWHSIPVEELHSSGKCRVLESCRHSGDEVHVPSSLDAGLDAKRETRKNMRKWGR